MSNNNNINLKSVIQNTFSQNQRGGQTIPKFKNIPAGSTSGSVSALARDIRGFVEIMVNTLSDTITFAETVIELPSDLYRAYEEPAPKTHLNF